MLFRLGLHWTSGKFDCQLLLRVLRHRAVQQFDRAFGLVLLVESYEAHTFRLAIQGIEQNAARDYFAAYAEAGVHVVTSPMLGQAAYVEVGAFDCLATGPRVRDLDDFVLDTEAVECLNSLHGVLGVQVVDKAVAHTLLTALVLYQLAAFQLTNGLKNKLELLADHRLRQIVDNQVGFALIRLAQAGLSKIIIQIDHVHLEGIVLLMKIILYIVLYLNWIFTFIARVGAF